MNGATRLLTLSVPLLATALLSYRAETAVTITEFPLPTAGSYPLFIAAGPDGNLWFTESAYFSEPGPNKIGRITSDGVITEFSIPTAGSVPFGIAAGPDGNVWFTEEVGNKIGRITPAGDITEFPLPASSSVPLGICLGPDGALWFTENVTGKIGRITPTGTITEFMLPAGSRPWTIASGPDDNLWFTEFMAYNIGRITTDGVVTEFPIGQHAYWIAAGPDGALWFTELDANKIGRITPSGVIAEFSIPTPSSLPEGICLGPGGELWFTEMLGDRISRVSLGLLYYTLPPCRVLDTRGALGPLGGPALGEIEARSFPFVGICGIPSDAAAVSGNVVAVEPSAAGHFRVFAADQPVPPTSVINFTVGKTRANNLFVGLSLDVTQSITIQNNSLGTANVVFDVNGYFK